MEDQGRLDEHLRGNMHDSGKRQQFASGAVRDTAENKPRPDLISPHAHLREGAWLGIGAQKYAERNWEAGIPISRCIASLCRHLAAYQLGLTDEDHMAAIRTNAGFILHYEEEIKAGRLDPAIDDMPKYTQRVGRFAHKNGMSHEQLNELIDMTMKDAPANLRQMMAAAEQNNVMSPPYHVLTFTGGPYPGSEAARVSGTILHDPIPGPEAARPFVERIDHEDLARPTGIELTSVVRERAETMKQFFRDMVAGALAQSDAIEAGLCYVCGKRHPEDASSTVYIAGPMRGYAQYNFPAFDGAAAEWENLGWDVINPAQMDRDRGFDPSEQAEFTEPLSRVMQRDLECILNLIPARGDGLAVLPGWEKSKGACTEVALARFLNLPVWDALTGKAIE